MAVATMENRYDQAEGYVKIYRNGGEGDWLDYPISATVEEDLYNDFLYYGLKAREVLRLWQGGEIITGLDWDYTEGDNKQDLSNGTTDKWNGEDFTILSPYVAVSQLIGQKDGFFLIPSAGVRYYDNNEFDEEWAPHAGIILGYKNTELHAGYSKGIIYPGLDVMVSSPNFSTCRAGEWPERFSWQEKT